ncbi:lipopolysaccharide biosynthesis protein [Methanohalobium sp.]|uniref:lipopolysaccharide biosynthesis protein n=1 Tax=Methanohalobium sp. TaxID=2837493 RepID=UPI0025F952D4|nr:polysaccharide biosynthesis C-terminal domain-containing protein [Methanohalobium sp.]
MSEYKLFAQRIGLVGITNFIGSLSGLILLPILTKNMSIESYGIWVQIIVTVGIVPNIVMLGLPAAMVRYLPSISSKKDFQDVFYSFLSIVIVTGFLASFLVSFFADNIAGVLFEGNAVAVRILSAIIFLESINGILFNYFRATQQIKKHSVLLITKTVLFILLVSFFVLMGEGLTGALAGLLTKDIMVLLVTIVMIISEIGIKKPNFANIKEYLGFGLPNVPGGMSQWIVNSSDRYVISGFLGASAVGLYSPGYTLGNIGRMFLAPLNFMLPMILSKYYDENNLDEVKKILSYSLKYFLAIGIPAVFGLSFLSEQILLILSTPEIASKGYQITPFVALSALVFGVFIIFEKVIYLEKKTKTIGKIWMFAAVLNLGLNILIIPYIGIIGAAGTTLLSFIVGLCLIVYYSSKYLKFDVNFRFISKSLIASILMSLIVITWDPTNLLNALVMIGISAVFYFVVLILMKGFSRDEIEFFKNLVKS